MKDLEVDRAKNDRWPQEEDDDEGADDELDVNIIDRCVCFHVHSSKENAMLTRCLLQRKIDGLVSTLISRVRGDLVLRVGKSGRVAGGRDRHDLVSSPVDSSSPRKAKK